MIEDVTQFSRISADDLKKIMGEPESIEDWINVTTKGEFFVSTWQYRKNDNHYEFIIADDSVIRLTIYSNKYWNSDGDLFQYSQSNKEDTLNYFN